MGLPCGRLTCQLFQPQPEVEFWSLRGGCTDGCRPPREQRDAQPRPAHPAPTPTPCRRFSRGDPASLGAGGEPGGPTGAHGWHPAAHSQQESSPASGLRGPPTAAMEPAGSSSSPVFCTKSRAARTQDSARHPLRAPILGAGTAAGGWPGGSGPQCSLPGGPGAYIAGSLGPEPGSWATQGSVLSPEAATCVCSRGGASAGKTPGGGRICGCGPLPPLSPIPRSSTAPENQRERGGHLVPGR